ncbi:erythrocyte membrane protein 1, PfEMP1 [Plasmodium reichenowi]|uniref:Erythrocyte membrane protein 1, PfEMP1 n=1 Tax=Plasmodium reichenowi TaxID=5854 RepID=A0A2P9DT10_PLARE|nr:erythrocyte membrane protein 1, PfEMP1 [Plasmodium reichenowi]
MDSKSIAEKIEAYLKEKSNESNIDKSLQADPSEVEYYRSGADGGYLRNHICKISINHSDSGATDPCDRTALSYGNIDEWKYQQNSSKASGKPENKCVPPRRQHMCIKNLEKLKFDKIRNNHTFLADVLITARNEGERIVQNHPDTNSSNVCVALERSFADIADIIRGRDENKCETKSTNNVEELIKKFFEKNYRSNEEYKRKYQKNDRNYRKLREAWWNANRQKVWEVITCSARTNDLLIKRGWKTSGKSNGENKFELFRKCGHYEEKVPTQLDYVPQFLRWLTEWIEDLYREKQNLIDDMERRIEECTTKDGKCKEVTSYCSTCKDKCKKYCECVKIWKSEWGNQKNKYTELYQKANENSISEKNTSSYDNYVKEFFKKLEEANYSSLENYITDDPYSKEYATKLSFILNSSDGNNVSGATENHNDVTSNCNESEIASFEEPQTSVRSSQIECNIHSSIKANKKKECKDVKLGVRENDRDLKVCVIEDDILRGVDNCCCQDLLRTVKEMCSNYNGNSNLSNDSCDNKNQDECRKNLERVVASLTNGYKCEKCKSGTSSSNKWIWGKYSGKGGGLQEEYANTIGLPPRTQSLCFGNLPKLENVCEGVTDINFDTNEKFLAGCLVAAFHDGKNLKTSPEKKNGDKNTKLCKALEYNFADYGDLIKGTSIWDNEYTKDLELNLQKTFGKLFRKYIKKNIGTEQNTLYSSLAELRESWWNTNKKYIWLAMKYGAEMNITMCGGNSGVSGSGDNGDRSVTPSGSTTCSGNNGSISCDDVPTTDLIPQYLRFLQEWVEHFCVQRQGKVQPVIKNCKSYKNNSGKTKIDEKCKNECKSKCAEYKKFIEECGTAGGGTGTAGSSWVKRWDQIYKRYSKHIEDAKRNLEAGTNSCGTSSGATIGVTTAASKCVQSDIDSFFKHLIDIGLTTPSSYLSIVLDENNCGDDKAPWTTYTTYTTTKNCDKDKKKQTSQKTDTPVVVNVPSPLSNTPYEYKYVCECRTPSNKELCDDRKEYTNQWNCNITKKEKGSGSGKDDYELYTYNGVEIKPPILKPNSTKLNDKDVTFFNLFEQWNKEIQYQIEQYMTNTKISCNNEKKVLNSVSDEGAQPNGNGHENGGNNSIDQGTNCKEKCKCYKLWMENIKKQWKTQNRNYNTFETKKIYEASIGSQKKEIVNLSNFLFFSCWEEYIQKQFNGDWSKIKNIGSDTFEFLIKKCGHNLGDGETIFNKKLNNTEQKCNETPNTDTKINESETVSDCNATNYIRGCQSKSYDGFMSPSKGGEKQWICKDMITHGDINGACIPPRTQNLCVGNLWDKSYGGKSNIKNDTIDTLKNKLKNAIQKETELLYEYHDKGTAIISQNPMKEGGDGQIEQKRGGEEANNNNSNGMPKGFCHAVQRSFIDYKNMILGTSVNTYENIEKLQEDIKKIIEKGTNQRSGKAVGGADKVNEWWNKIEKDMWDGVRCGIQTMNKKKKNSKINGDECGISPPTGNDEDQFVSWFKEWGEQFCIERLSYEKDIREACPINGKDQNKCIISKSGQGDKIEGECKRKCEKYKKYISDKKQEWDKQKTKYENKYVGKSASDLLKVNYPECISANFDFIFNDNAEYKTYYPYGDYSNICSCEQVKYNEYNNAEKKHNKSLCREKDNDMTWSKKYIKKLGKGRSLEGVYVPPRRQQLCLYEIFPIIIKKNKNNITNVKKELLETLKIVSEREAYYLWKQYHINSDTPNLAHKKACCAIRASFYDLGDIIKGNDLVHDEYTKYIDTTLNEIFRGNSSKNDIETKRLRRDWWENETIQVDDGTDHKTIRQLVWYAMQSGVRYAIKEKKEKFPLCMVVEHIGIAKPQFIRWLEEWTNEFCEEYAKYFRDIKSKCDPPKRADNCGDNTNIACKKACTNYTNWLNPKRIEWNGMSNYYNKIYRKSNKESEDGEDYSMIMAPTIIQYLNKRCHGDINGNYICCSCKNIGENSASSTPNKKATKKTEEDEEEKGPLGAINEVLSKMDDKYKNYKVNCTKFYLEHIEEQLKEIENTINNYKLYPLDRCFDDKRKMKICDLIGDAIGCKDKTKLEDLDEWNDMDLREPYNKHKGVLIPPRRRQLCFSRIVRSPANLRNLNEFKEEILKGALSEGKFLGNYYKEHKDKEKALEAMKNSFYDYEDIIKGADMLAHIKFKDIKRKLETLLKKETNDTKKTEDWWETNKKSIWNAMLCGYKKSGNNMFLGESSWCKIITTEKTPQFLRWIKEWGKNVCIEKEKYKQNVKSECSNITNIDLVLQESESNNCTSEITKYQEWSRKRSVQWETISERYKKYKGTDVLKDVKEPDANEYLKEHCSKCPCGYNDMEEISNDTEKKQEIFKRIIEKADIPAELEDVIYRIKRHKYDTSNDYICSKYNNKKFYDGMKNHNDTTWTDDLVKKSWEINKGVLLPPRRKNLFLKIEESDICKYKKNPEMFKDFIYSTAISEVERLKKVYGNDKDKVAHAMKYSFADIGNIIKGDDMMENNPSDKIGKILGGKDGKNDNRKKWWDANKYHIWESMICTYKKAYGNISDNDKKLLDIPNNDEEYQFLRWFTEWSEDFCIKQKEQLTILENKCNFRTCEDEKDNEKKKQCLQACWNYKAFLNIWKKQYKKQNIEYEGLRDLINIREDMDAPKYLEENCKDKCSCIKKADYTNYNMSFQYPPENFQNKCSCELSDKKWTQKIENPKKNREPEPIKEDPYKDLGKCPFQNSANGGDTTVINNDNCKNLNVQRSCVQNEYKNNLDQWKGSFVQDMFGKNKEVLVPPRRRHLCRTPFIGKIYRSKDEDIFRNDFYTATFNQGYLLGKKFKDYKHDKTVHEALKNSFADYGDIVKGTDMMETTRHTNIKEKLEKLLENAEKTAQSNGTPPQPKTVNEWWEKYRTHVWNAMLCGYHKGINGTQTLGIRRGRQSQPVTAPTSSPTTKNIPSNWCDLPKEDETSQFLRWMKEWGTQYCKEKQQLKSDMQIPCKPHFDKYGIIEKRNDVHPNCLPNVEKYEVWSNNRLPQWKRLSRKFHEVKDSMNENVKKLTAYEYLKQNCSECKCSFKDIEQTNKKSKDEGYHVYEDILDKAQIPSFLEDTAYRYKGLHPECPEDIECSQYGNIQCKGLVHDDDNDWSPPFIKDNNTINKGVLLPPRRKHLCLRIYPERIDYLRSKIENFKNFICSSALAEAKRLKQVYKDDSKLLQAMKYSFADIGNIVKGEDMIESPTSEYINKIFKGRKYGETDRTKWWNENKYHVWESMLCGYKKAGGDTQKAEKCRFPDTDSIPQFLRWFQEWTKIFCLKRDKLYDKMVTECQNAECDTSNGTVKDTKCTTACEEYKSYVLKKKKEYYIQKDKYDNEFKNILNNKDATIFLKVQCLSEKFNDKEKWNDPYNTFDDNSNLKSKCECAKSETKGDAKQCSVSLADEKSQDSKSPDAAASDEIHVASVTLQGSQTQEGSDGAAQAEDSLSTQTTSPTEAEGAQRQSPEVPQEAVQTTSPTSSTTETEQEPVLETSQPGSEALPPEEKAASPPTEEDLHTSPKESQKPDRDKALDEHTGDTLFRVLSLESSVDGTTEGDSTSSGRISQESGTKVTLQQAQEGAVHGTDGRSDKNYSEGNQEQPGKDKETSSPISAEGLDKAKEIQKADERTGPHGHQGEKAASEGEGGVDGIALGVGGEEGGTPSGPGSEGPTLAKGDDLSFAPLFNVLTYSAPLRISLLLGSVAFLFFYLKVIKIYIYMCVCFIYVLCLYTLYIYIYIIHIYLIYELY